MCVPLTLVPPFFFSVGYCATLPVVVDCAQWQCILPLPTPLPPSFPPSAEDSSGITLDSCPLDSG